MWSDKELDDAFRRLNPPEPEAEPFPLDAWLRLETQLDKQLMEREFRRRLWRFLAIEMLVVAAGVLLWLAWPTRPAATATTGGQVPAATQAAQAAEVATTATREGATGSRRPADKPGSRQLTKSVVANGAGATAAPANPVGNTLSQNATPESIRPAPASRLPLAAGTTSAVRNTAADSATSESRQPLLAAGVVASTRQRSTTTRASAKSKSSAGARPLAGIAAVQSRPELAGHGPGLTYSTKRRGKQAVAAATATGGARHSQSGTAAFQAESASQPESHTSAALASAASAATDSAEGATTSFAHLQPLPVVLLTGSPTALPAPLATLSVTPAPLPEPLQQPRFYLGLLAAPDVSTVKMADYQAPTPNVGVLLEYRLTSRLRVNTGLLKSTKQYRARRQDYDWSYYPIGGNGDFKWVDGRCTILDVPVNLRYDVFVRPRYQVFGSLGLSSLFMQHETYAYDYTYYGTLYHWQSSFTNENQHWFSVLNISAGYERNLGRHWRLQAEPYLKLPLGGVGAGKVRLMSGGVFFGVKYGF